MTLSLYSAALWLHDLFLAYFSRKKHKNNFYYKKKSTSTIPYTTENHIHYRCKAKPLWVKKEVIRLSALMPNNGCRKIASTFNRLNHHKKSMTVSKSFVNYTLKNNWYDVQCLRQKIKHKKAPPFPSHRLWSLDLTHVVDDQNNPHQLLGIVDNGSRYCVSLQKVENKTSLALLRVLLNAIEKKGKPKSLRTDNEACFTSRLFRFGLWWLGIQHQRSDKHCPWQNGKIERFFGTFKERLNHYTISAATIARDIQSFTNWYNHVRPHYHLNGKTPAEQHTKKNINKQGKNHYVRFWGGALTGFYLPPD